MKTAAVDRPLLLLTPALDIGNRTHAPAPAPPTRSNRAVPTTPRCVADDQIGLPDPYNVDTTPRGVVAALADK